MKNLINYQQSLGRRFTLSAVMMLIPLVVLVVFQYSIFNVTMKRLNEVVDHAFYELNLISRLQHSMHMAVMAPNDYLVHGNRNERKNYESVVRDVTADMKRLSEYIDAYPHEREDELMQQLQQQWQLLDQMSRSILASPSPMANSKLAGEMEVLDGISDNLAATLDYLHEAVVIEVKHYEGEARELRTLMIALIFGGATITAILILWLNNMLARSVLEPICCLKAAAARVGKGEYDTRLQWSRGDEIGELSRSFDEMTDSLDVAHSELERLSRKDGLTGILNRREFDRLFRKEFNRSERYSKTLSMILIDLDHFKEINDSHGHQVGDSVLRTVVTVIEKTIRDVDQFARYGGEEFVLLLPETSAREAMMLATRLCGLVGTTEFRNRSGDCFKVTISAGVSSYPEHESSERDLLLAADQALYRAKRNGRNCAEFPRETIKAINT